MKSILEKALVHLLNEENEQAQELMHQFVVSTAKEIHESLREGDDMDMDSEPLEEEFFTEADLEDAEAADNLSDDLDDSTVSDDDLGDEDAPAMDGEDMGDDADAAPAMDGEDMGDDMDAEAPVADRLDDIEDEIKALQAEFDRVMAEFDDSESDEDMGGDDMGADASMDTPDTMPADEDGEDFDEVTESMVDDLKKISVTNTDGLGANGEKLGRNIPSPIAKDAKPMAPRSKNTVGHTGFEREKAPMKKDGPDRGRKYDNDRKTATAPNTLVPASGPKAAELSKPVAGNTKSVIAGRKPGSK